MIKIRLNELLEEKGKTLYWLSKNTGISYNALTKISKNNVKRLELDTINKILNVLNCEKVTDLLSVES